MNNYEYFDSATIKGLISSNDDCIAQFIKRYSPYIKKVCTENNEICDDSFISNFDEDKYAYILSKLLISVKKFKIYK